MYQGIKNIYRGVITAVESDKVVIEDGAFKIIALKEKNFNAGHRVKFCIRPQDIKILKDNEPVRDELKDNLFTGEIVSHLFHNEFCNIKFKSIVDFKLKFPIYIYQRYHFHVGKKIFIGIWQKGISIFSDEE
ncbi:MAG: hypothetical protein JXN64_10445 [Spirochaetes bacterium]|nr:hypothetical protein [Spirochaetota bacterium]